MHAGDRERDRATAALREHYVGGRLTVDELSNRTGRVLTARSRAEVRGALSGLPVLPDARELADRGRSALQATLRAAVLVALTGAYLVFSMLLLLVLALTLLFHGASDATLVVFLVVWLIPTYLLTRLWHRRPPRRRPSM
jgi:Flp pilus assembly protein TadB